MHVFIKQLIECKLSFKRNFYMDWNFEFLFCYFAAWHEVEQNKCKHDQQLSYNNKIRDLFNEMDFKDVCCERCRKSKPGCPNLVIFFSPTRILCTRHLQAICFSPPNYQQFAHELTFKEFERCSIGALRFPKTGCIL